VIPVEDEELWMLRENLDDLPSHPLPPGYAIRWHQPGDELIWAELQAPFYEPGAITPETFYRWFGTDAGAHARRIAFLVDASGQAVATSAAWSHDGFRGPEWGRVHWVAVAEGYQGRGLGKALLSATLRRLVELGHTKAYLTTSRDRPKAVGLYRYFGFVEL
jgi:GNAT superfamily N-acetyltransferase